MRLSIVIPAYNEENRISKTLHSIYKEFPLTTEVVVVSNGSTDNTCDIVRTAQKNYPNLTVYEFKEKLGKGGALIEGFQKVKGQIIGFIDADDSFEMSGVHHLIRLLDHSDCAIASKWMGKTFSEIDEPTGRKILSRCWNALVKILLRLPFRETQAGAKFFTRRVYDAINKDFICHGFAFDAELLFRIKQKGFSIIEVHIPHKHVEESTFSTIYIWQMFVNILRLRWKAWWEETIHEERVAEYYDGRAETYQEQFSTGGKGRLRTLERRVIWKFLQPQSGDEILDAGCGSGFDAIPLQKAGALVYGVDISPVMVQKAKENGISAQVGNLEKISLQKTFAKIICSGALEFCTSPQNVLINLAKHLNKGGICVILYPRKTLMGLLYKTYHKIGSNINIHLFTTKEIQECTKKAGLIITRYEKPHSFAGVICLTKK